MDEYKFHPHDSPPRRATMLNGMRDRLVLHGARIAALEEIPPGSGEPDPGDLRLHFDNQLV